jgi:hypothetical protein
MLPGSIHLHYYYGYYRERIRASANTLGATVNGVTGATVPIINTNSLTLSNDSLTSTINGVASNTMNLAGSNWALKGNAGTVPGTNFLGTTDNNPLVIKTKWGRKDHV